MESSGPEHVEPCSYAARLQKGDLVPTSTNCGTMAQLDTREPGSARRGLHSPGPLLTDLWSALCTKFNPNIFGVGTLALFLTVAAAGVGLLPDTKVLTLPKFLLI